VDLLYPADILANGTVIIDTPSVGSTLQHNTEAAVQVLPESDAALFVISADPPITEVELDYLHRLKSKTARVFYILNKADYLRPDERRSVVEFVQKVLAEKLLIDADERIFCISARDGLNAKQNRDEHMLARSGILELGDHLVRSLASEKKRWLDNAVRSKAEDILAQASTELSLRVRALNMPIQELAAKSEGVSGSVMFHRGPAAHHARPPCRRASSATRSVGFSHRTLAQGDRWKACGCDRCGPFRRCYAGFGGSNPPDSVSSNAKRIRGGTQTVGECVCCRCWYGATQLQRSG
jgi:hypothetical protein